MTRKIDLGTSTSTLLDLIDPRCRTRDGCLRNGDFDNMPADQKSLTKKRIDDIELEVYAASPHHICYPPRPPIAVIAQFMSGVSI